MTRRGEPLPINQALNRPRAKLGLDLATWMAILFVCVTVFLVGFRIVTVISFPMMERVTDQREGEERDSAESQNCGNCIRGVFIVSVDRWLGCDDRRYAADRRTDSKQRGELWLELECAAQQMHEGQRQRNRDGDKKERDASQMQHIPEQKA